MVILKTIAWIFIVLYVTVVVLLYTLQSRLIFYPGKLSADYRFRLRPHDRELFLETQDGERINALFFRGTGDDVILYFHGNAGDLSGWQYVAKDFTDSGFNVFLIDYRGYGKSTGRLSEKGMYRDAKAAYDYLIAQGFPPSRILIYGRSIGSGVAVALASRVSCKGLVLESPFSSLSRLANEKLPLFFPSLYLRFRFDNLAKINQVKCPVLFLHGSHDTLIPLAHSQKLYEHFQGKKQLITVERGAHNDLHTFPRYEQFLRGDLRTFF